ncbi:hypothetical protein B296_00054002 [Ensete ventricosum]|uniref:Uncharacterized protein n=1 Tax=Ensete ventricosum TaxID=4639 RepID=A0A426X8H3_ENSVE|nr:hypothetical protein B296_00054002 [Ensete ventricosum]
MKKRSQKPTWKKKGCRRPERRTLTEARLRQWVAATTEEEKRKCAAGGSGHHQCGWVVRSGTTMQEAEDAVVAVAEKDTIVEEEVEGNSRWGALVVAAAIEKGR